MGKFVAEQTIKHLVRNGWQVKDAPVIVLGLTFKEDCADLRNSRVIDVIRELQSYGAEVVVHDPVAAPAEALHEYGVELVPWDRLPKAAAIVAAVAHRAFKARPVSDYLERLLPNSVVADVKSQFDADDLEGNGVTVWRL
jgi:UDP-N-acetyl-D-galactosamine dehydrogenase